MVAEQRPPDGGVLVVAATGDESDPGYRLYWQHGAALTPALDRTFTLEKDARWYGSSRWRVYARRYHPERRR